MDCIEREGQWIKWVNIKDNVILFNPSIPITAEKADMMTYDKNVLHSKCSSMHGHKK